MTFATLLILAISYLIGAFPTAHLVGWRYGVNLRQSGDGNLGGLNAYRVLGWKPALVVSLVDISKGALTVWLADSLSTNPIVPYLAALAAALGHDFSIYVRFVGGQGMAAILGSLLYLQPWETLLGVGLFLLCYILFRNWDLAWGVGMVAMIASAWVWRIPFWQIALLVVLISTIGLKKWIDMPLARRIRESHP
jgi:glycerol-3-phosphate acyltransferase PlsY